MAKSKKKRMKLPNGFGSIKYLGANRRNPYAVYPPVEEWTPKGPVTPPALGYKESWEDAYELLTAYNLEKKGKVKVNKSIYIDRTPTFSEVYDQFFQEKYNRADKKFSDSSKRSTYAAFKNCKVLHDKQMGQIKYDDLQDIVNSCPLKHASIELIISLMHQIYKYSLKYEIVDKDYSQFLYMPKEDDDESGIPFTDDEIKILWENSSDPIIQMIIIMCYSGYRIIAYENIEVNLTENYFKGGVKTKASKDRIVPIHSAIIPLVTERFNNTRNLLKVSPSKFRKELYETLERLKINRHTPHDCRHTFSMLCEKFGVNENDRKRMLGHSFGSDITNAKYGHRSLEDLRKEIEKIEIP